VLRTKKHWGVKTFQHEKNCDVNLTYMKRDTTGGKRKTRGQEVTGKKYQLLTKIELLPKGLVGRTVLIGKKRKKSREKGNFHHKSKEGSGFLCRKKKKKLLRNRRQMKMGSQGDMRGEKQVS